jgi:hypothetical protein
MKLLIILQTIVSLLLDPPSVYVKGKGYSGYIFNKEHSVMVSIKNQQGRFTPTFEEVERAEKLLKSRLPELNKDKISQGEKCGNIEKELESYTRQYVGFINQKGNKIIWVNMLMHLRSVPSKHIIIVDDGGSNYWNVKIDITSRDVYDLEINGVG